MCYNEYIWRKGLIVLKVFLNAFFFRVNKTQDCEIKDDTITQQSQLLITLGSKACKNILKQEGHDGPEIAHLSLLTKHAPSSFPVT